MRSTRAASASRPHTQVENRIKNGFLVYLFIIHLCRQMTMALGLMCRESGSFDASGVINRT